MRRNYLETSETSSCHGWKRTRLESSADPRHFLGSLPSLPPHMPRRHASALAVAAFAGGADALSFATGGLLSQRGLLFSAGSTLSEPASSATAATSATGGSPEPESFDVRQLAGAVAPLGFWDPLNFAGDASEGKIRFYREVELKHGRVAMLASVGILVSESFHPLWGGQIDVPAYIAFQETPLQTFWPAVLLAISVIEVFSVFAFESPFGGEAWTIRTDHVPGDVGFDPLDLRPASPAEFKDMQTKELQNGRLAMISAAGMIGQELATGSKLFA